MRKIFFRHFFAIVLLSYSMAAVVTACSSVDEADRLTTVSTIYRDTIPETKDTIAIDYFQPYQRHVLIEDFTGQNCVYCPNATDLIASIQEMLGHETVVAVAIHSGPLGVKASKNAEGLATELGDNYYSHWNIEVQPYGLINRSFGPQSSDQWTAMVNYQLNAEQWPATQCNIFADTSEPGTVSITLAGMKGTVDGKLQLWLIEDGITAFQKMPDGTTNTTYTHNHVLRSAINGTWGDDCTVTQGQLWQRDYAYTTDGAWKPENMSVVAFVYNDNGVIQTTRTKLQTK